MTKAVSLDKDALEKVISRPRRDIHVIPFQGKWVVTRGSSEHSTSHDSKKEAISEGRRIAKNQAGELIVHERDGSIRSRDSFSTEDSNPIRSSN
jgi:hypothetical protein